jgi:hypothetical protein
MRKSWITLGIMLAAILALAAWIYLHPATRHGERVPISMLAPASVHKLRLERRGKPALEMQQTDGQWRIVAPFAARAEPAQVDRLLSVLTATAELALPAADLARFELEHPRARLTIDGLSFSFGAVNPVTGNVYVLSGERVFLLEPKYANVLPTDPNTVIDRRLLATDEAPVLFTFPQFEVRQEAGNWGVTPRDAELSQDDLLRWVEGWRLASALRAEPHEGPAPATHITVGLRDGRRIAIGVTEHAGEIAFTRYDEHLRYYFFGNNARRLLAPPSITPAGEAVQR